MTNFITNIDPGWFTQLLSYAPSEFNIRGLLMQSFPVFACAEGLRLFISAFLSIFPAMFKKQKRAMADEITKKLSDFLGYGGNIFASFFLASYNDIHSGDALIYGGVSIIIHLAWKEIIFERWVKIRMRKRA